MAKKKAKRAKSAGKKPAASRSKKGKTTKPAKARKPSKKAKAVTELKEVTALSPTTKTEKKRDRAGNVDVYLGLGGGTKPIISWVRFDSPAWSKIRTAGKALAKDKASGVPSYKLALFEFGKAGLEVLLGTKGKNPVPWKPADDHKTIDLKAAIEGWSAIAYPPDGELDRPNFKGLLQIVLATGIKRLTGTGIDEKDAAGKK